LRIKDFLNSNIRLLIFKLILKPFNNILKTIIIKSKTIKNNIYKTIFNYNNNIIVINIKEMNNKISDLKRYKYTRLI